jgi:hypothetical protein
MPDVTVICIVPVKNESWILKNLIECAQQWADIILVGDNRSSDDSTNILRQFPAVQVIDIGPAFDEHNRRTMLIEAARKIPGKRLIFSIDADEMLSANCKETPEWEMMIHAPAGTSFILDWVAAMPGLRKYIIEHEMPAAFMDDGTEYCGVKMHSPRIPNTSGEAIKLTDVKLLHYAYIDPERLLSKHRMYKCFELIENNNRPWRICITYQDTQIKDYGKPILLMQDEWLKGFNWLESYRETVTGKENCYWYDEEVLNYFDKFGKEKFRKINIWDIDWNKKAQLLGRKGDYKDPRSMYEKWVHRFIEQNREDLKIKQNFKYKAIRLFGKTVLHVLGW